MLKLRDFLKKEVVFCISFIAAIVSCFFVTPDSEYFSYIDFRTLALLYCLMVVVAGLRKAGLFSYSAHFLCLKAGNTRVMGFVLVALCFFSSMFLTNDVALITFVPFAVGILDSEDNSGELVTVVVLQTVAANLGSMLTPVGNPQNLYICSYYDLPIASFFSVTFPVWGASLVLVCALCFLIKRKPVNADMGQTPLISKRDVAVFSLLFAVCMLTVFRVISWQIMLICVIAVLAVYRIKILADADFMLLFTFVCFFVFSGNLERIDAVNSFLKSALEGRVFITSLLCSQVISNVPSALLLSSFTSNFRSLLLGVDIGGLGTPVASLASLISMKLYTHASSCSMKRFILVFTGVNILLLLILCPIFG